MSYIEVCEPYFSFMYCSQCGTLRFEDAKFCASCGTQFDEVVNNQPEPEQEITEEIQETESLEKSGASERQSPPRRIIQFPALERQAMIDKWRGMRAYEKFGFIWLLVTAISIIHFFIIFIFVNLFLSPWDLYWLHEIYWFPIWIPGYEVEWPLKMLYWGTLMIILFATIQPKSMISRITDGGPSRNATGRLDDGTSNGELEVEEHPTGLARPAPESPTFQPNWLGLIKIIIKVFVLTYGVYLLKEQARPEVCVPTGPWGC
ncbi:uncharacterized protein METZ01_LOCUS169723 [marine metagenome]|uniref:Zinc-ribbon domain-containing protein n=1 Tax=marine metagenome TaxID=408172 RepID=A0A382BTD3_9ZZZZ